MHNNHNQDNYLSDNEASEAIIRGVDKVANAVKGTYGAAGYNAILEHHLQPYAETTNDGVSIAKSIMLADPYERIGANLVKEIASRSDKQSNDGTTTAVILLQAILKEGIKLKKRYSGMEIKRSLEACIPLIEESLHKQSKEITVDDVGVVATVSAEDKTIGNLIQEIYQTIGKDGIIFRDISKTFEDSYTIGNGIRIEGAGFASPYMADQDEENRFTGAASYKKPAIIVTKQKINSAKELENIMVALNGANHKELIIFADDYDQAIVTNLLLTRLKQGFKTTIVKMPVLWKDWWFEDIAKITGATIIDPNAGISFKNLSLNHIGSCGSIIVTKDDTFIDGVLDVSEHIKELQERGDDDGKIRAARLNTKTARLFVGAPTDQALSYRRLKYEDAVGSAWQALHGGIVPGGGVALVEASHALPDTIGGEILKNALLVPAKQIASNAGKSDMVIGDDYREGRGYDVKNDQFCSMFDAGIVDATAVVTNSVRNALSVAAAVLSTEVVVRLPLRTEVQNPDMQVL